MVVVFRLQVENQVNRTVVGVRLRLDVHVLRVEVSCLGNLAGGAHKVFLREEFARAHTQLAAYYLLIQAVVAVDHDVVDASLRTLDHPHLERNAVALDFRLDRHELEEEVSVVHIQVGNGVVVLKGALVEQFLVVHIAGFHSEDCVESRRRVDGVASPRNVGDIVFLTLLDVDMHVDKVVFVSRHAVAQDFGVAVAKFVVFLDDESEVGFVVLLHEFFLAEKIQEFRLLVGFLHCALDFVVRQHVIAVDIYFVDFYLFVFVDVDVHNHLVLLAEVGRLRDVDIHVSEAFLLEVGRNDFFCALHDVLRDLVAWIQVQPLLQLLALVFLHAVVVDLRDARLLAQVEQQPSLVAAHFFYFYLDFREQTLSPESLCGACDGVAWDFHNVAHRQTGVSYDDIVLIVLESADPDSRDFIFFRHSGEKHRRIVDCVCRLRGFDLRNHHSGQQRQGYKEFGSHIFEK